MHMVVYIIPVLAASIVSTSTVDIAKASKGINSANIRTDTDACLIPINSNIVIA